MKPPPDYLERVYAGVLGKMIGVYLGRPIEGWTYERIMAELGEVDCYVNDRVSGSPPLVVTDDDLAGTFVFLRALPEHGNDPHLTPAQIGATWLNQLIEEHTILWWGGMGNSTEHTAFLRLKSGIAAPESGSIARNGKIVAEQIGAQIFIDGWAMVHPGDPEKAAHLAGRVARVSHDGEAVYGAQVIAAMESLAFVEPDIEKLLDTAMGLIPPDARIFEVIEDVRSWHAVEPDWHSTRARIAARYGYDRYGGVCHMVPNHALIILGLLYGKGDFQQSMRVVNTAGWDTDCNAGNLGCLLGIRSGLKTFANEPDWRGPVNDRLYLVSAEGGQVVTDALQTAYWTANIGRALAGDLPLLPKRGARFHFEASGSTQGFTAADTMHGEVSIENAAGFSQSGARTLAISYRQGRAAVSTPTFVLPDELEMPGGYALVASPALYAGQTLRAGVLAMNAAEVALFVRVYNVRAALDTIYGPRVQLAPEQHTSLTWQLPDMRGQPIAEVGLSVEARDEGAGTVHLDYLTWDGEPELVLSAPPGVVNNRFAPQVWRRAWVNGVDRWDTSSDEAYRLVQNEGRGLIIQGTRDWKDYSLNAVVESTMMAAGGIAARVQGMQRYYALLLCAGGQLRLVKAMGVDQVLAEKQFPWMLDTPVDLRLDVQGTTLRGWADGTLHFDVVDEENPLRCGAAALVCEEGLLACESVKITPVKHG